MLLRRSHRLWRNRSRLMLPASTVSASAAALMGKRCAVCSMCWSGDDSASLGCTGLACGRTNRHEARHGWPGSPGPGSPAPDPHAGDLYVFRGARGNLIKILWHDGLGMSLYAKSLEKCLFI